MTTVDGQAIPLQLVTPEGQPIVQEMDNMQVAISTDEAGVTGLTVSVQISSISPKRVSRYS